MNVKSLLIPVFLTLFFFMCNVPDKREESMTEVDSPEVNNVVDPERIYFKLSKNAIALDDFNESIEKGDFRFVGILEFSLVVPSVPDYYQKYSRSNGVKIIEGTSDSYSYKDSGSLPPTTFYKNYASDYNELLLKYLGDLNN